MYSFKNFCSNLIPTGKYKMQVVDIKFAAGGSKNVIVNLMVAEGPYAKRQHIENIPEKAYSFRLMPFLKACKVDVDREFATAEELFKFGFASAKGKFLMADIGIRTYNGQDYNNITDFSPIPDSTVSSEAVTEAFGEAPEVAADVVVSEPEATANEALATADEPVLDVDGFESPF